MPNKTECQLAFEIETLTWGLDYERDETGEYTEYATGIMYGPFQLGWDAAKKNG